RAPRSRAEAAPRKALGDAALLLFRRRPNLARAARRGRAPPRLQPTRLARPRARRGRRHAPHSPQATSALTPLFLLFSNQNYRRQSQSTGPFCGHFVREMSTKRAADAASPSTFVHHPPKFPLFKSDLLINKSLTNQAIHIIS